MRVEDLSERQRAVVNADGLVTVVLGGAGTGKTTAALYAARRALEDPACSSWKRVLFLTFSRTAVDQIANRSRGVLAGIRDRVDISTFHAFAHQMLCDFGRYHGFGQQPPRLLSAAQTKLFGARSDDVTYDDLLPRVLQLLESNRLREHLAKRWTVVICDEFQDTDAEQWRLLAVLRQRARLVLLGDPNQMIYTFVPGVSAQRLDDAKALADTVIELEPASHRDPTGTIPAMADALRRRDFHHDAVHHALQQGALRIHTNVYDHQLADAIATAINVGWKDGARSFGIFGHSNDGVANLASLLTNKGIDHAIVGLPEAQGEALAAMAASCAYGADKTTTHDFHVALATFLTACSRGKYPPALAAALARGTSVPEALQQRLAAVSQKLRRAALHGADELADAAIGVWPALGIGRNADRWWTRAVPVFRTAVRQRDRRLPDTETIGALLDAIRRLRVEALVDTTSGELPPVRLMNFHQTKGREADLIILVYRDNDYLTGRHAQEPYPTASRVLYVTLTRARQRVVVLLPSSPHPLVAPFSTLALSPSLMVSS